MEDQIRFYLNDTQYIVATEHKSGCKVSLGDTKYDEEEKNNHSILKSVGEKLKVLALTIGLYVGWCIVLWNLCKNINNTLVSVLIINMSFLIIGGVNAVILGFTSVPQCIKYKHSAEHMIANFLENNGRLPKNLDELKRSSRFAPNCGSRELTNGIAEEFVRGSFSAIISFFLSIIVGFIYSGNEVTAMTFIIGYFLIRFIIGKLIKNGKISYIISPIKKVLTNITQLGNTTSRKNVKDNDLFLAYASAELWMKIVYPEFYNEEELIFWKQHMEIS